MENFALQIRFLLFATVFSMVFVGLLHATVHSRRRRIPKDLPSPHVPVFVREMLVCWGLCICLIAGPVFGLPLLIGASVLALLVIVILGARRQQWIVVSLRERGYAWFGYEEFGPYYCLVGPRTEDVPLRDEAACLPSYRDGDVYSLIEIILLRRAAKGGESAVDSRGLAGNDRVGSPGRPHAALK